MSKYSDDGELRFHYSRSDRLELGGSDREETRRGGVFRRNRSLTIVLIDIMIIIVIYVLFAFVFNAQPRNESYAGYDFSLRAVAFANEVLCTLTVSRNDPTDEVVGRPAAVRFESGAAQETVLDLLPSGNRRQRIFRARLPKEQSSGEVAVTVTIGEHQFKLESTVEEE